MMVENTIAFFYPNNPSSTTRAPQLLDDLPTRSQEVILTNMKQLVSLTLETLKSVYHRADLDVVGESFAVTYTNEEDSKLMEDSTVMAD
jgi:hypothetical protein